MDVTPMTLTTAPKKVCFKEEDFTSPLTLVFFYHDLILCLVKACYFTVQCEEAC